MLIYAQKCLFPYHLVCALLNLFYLCAPLFYTFSSLYVHLCGLLPHTVFAALSPLIVYVCVFAGLWWAGRKSAVKWGVSSNVGQDWDRRDWETDPSALCKSSLQKQLALSLSHRHLQRETHTDKHTLAHTNTPQYLIKYMSFLDDLPCEKMQHSQIWYLLQICRILSSYHQGLFQFVLKYYIDK